MIRRDLDLFGICGQNCKNFGVGFFGHHPHSQFSWIEDDTASPQVFLSASQQNTTISRRSQQSLLSTLLFLKADRNLLTVRCSHFFCVEFCLATSRFVCQHGSSHQWEVLRAPRHPLHLRLRIPRSYRLRIPRSYPLTPQLMLHQQFPRPI